MDAAHDVICGHGDDRKGVYSVSAIPIQLCIIYNSETEERIWWEPRASRTIIYMIRYFVRAVMLAIG